MAQWYEVFERLLPHTVCVDIETTGWNGAIAIVGIYRPKDGVIEVDQLIRGRTLSRDALLAAFSGVQLIVTFNGDAFDLKKIEEEFAGVLPLTAARLDLYRIAKSLGYLYHLKLLEYHCNVERPEWMWQKRRIAVRLWRRYAEHGDEAALRALLEYNAQDTANLYLVALELAKAARAQQGRQEALF